MKPSLHRMKSAITILAILFTSSVIAKVFKWQLVNPTYSSVDPDGNGQETGSVTFTLQIHTTSGSVGDVNVLTVGYSYQSANAMIPSSPGCVTGNAPNITL